MILQRQITSKNMLEKRRWTLTESQLQLHAIGYRGYYRQGTNKSRI